MIFIWQLLSWRNDAHFALLILPFTRAFYFPFHFIYVFHSIFHHILQKKKSNFKKKMRTVATNSKEKSKKFTPLKSEKFASKKKKSYQATAKSKLGVQVAKKKQSRSLPDKLEDLWWWVIVPIQLDKSSFG